MSTSTSQVKKYLQFDNRNDSRLSNVKATKQMVKLIGFLGGFVFGSVCGGAVGAIIGGLLVYATVASFSTWLTYENKLTSSLERSPQSDNSTETGLFKNSYSISLLLSNSIQKSYLDKNLRPRLWDENIRTNNELHNAILGLLSKGEIERIIETTDENIVRTWLTQKSLGNTPLLLAAKTCHCEAIEVLCTVHKKLGISVEEEDGSYLRALHWACFFKNTRMIIALMSAGAHPKNGYRVSFNNHLIAKNLIAIAPKEYASAFNKILQENIIIKENEPHFIEAGNLSFNQDQINFSDVFFHLDRVAFHLKLLSKKELESLKTNKSCDYFKNSTKAIKAKFLEYIVDQHTQKGDIENLFDNYNKKESRSLEKQKSIENSTTIEQITFDNQHKINQI